VSDYQRALKADVSEAARYYSHSLNTKTEQQKFLEQILDIRRIAPTCVADIACGGGGSSLHLSQRYPDAWYVLIDSNDEAISIAQRAVAHLKAECIVGDIYGLKLDTDSFDLVICWQTLSYLDEPEKALA